MNKLGDLLTRLRFSCYDDAADEIERLVRVCNYMARDMTALRATADRYRSAWNRIKSHVTDEDWDIENDIARGAITQYGEVASGRATEAVTERSEKP